MVAKIKEIKKIEFVAKTIIFFQINREYRNLIFGYKSFAGKPKSDLELPGVIYLKIEFKVFDKIKFLFHYQ